MLIFNNLYAMKNKILTEDLLNSMGLELNIFMILVNYFEVDKRIVNMVQ